MGNEIIAALKALGYKHGKVTVRLLSHYALVKLDGVYFGTWDFNTKTFAD